MDVIVKVLAVVEILIAVDSAAICNRLSFTCSLRHSASIKEMWWDMYVTTIILIIVFVLIVLIIVTIIAL